MAMRLFIDTALLSQLILVMLFSPGKLLGILVRRVGVLGRIFTGKYMNIALARMP